MPFHIEAWVVAFGKYGFQPDAAQLYRLEGIGTSKVVQIINREHDLNLTASECQDIATCKRQTYRRIFRPVPLPGADVLVEGLLRWRYTTAIVTGTARSSALAILNALNIHDLISLIISSDEEIPGKPDPAPFREAARRLGVRTTNCLAVDNAPPGIASAVAAGVPCVGIPTYLHSSELSEASLVLPDVTALAHWIDQEHDKSRGCGSWLISLSALGGKDGQSK
jgi:HAD superfamily hydrolase (TIGR01509 family)